ncbi:GIN domain-containing protein [Ferruginibacter yonginensis]|uniref:GIN domain-containing protein n=1 Tax=Ferruginibacter yonginensis TaxID=1310416 RepID=A0ABV8QP96_9BACT
MKNLITALLVLVSLASFAQVQQTRNVTGFTGISAATGIQVEITQAATEAVVVSAADEAYANGIVTVVENNILKIYFDSKKNNYVKSKKAQLKAFVSYVTIQKLMASSGAGISTTNTANTNDLLVDVTSGAQLKADIKATKLTIDMSSGATATLSGTATDVAAEFSSGAVCTATDLKTSICAVAATSGSVFKIDVQKSLSVKGTSGAVISYKGEPEIEGKKLNSGATLRRL